VSLLTELSFSFHYLVCYSTVTQRLQCVALSCKIFSCPPKDLQLLREKINSHKIVTHTSKDMYVLNGKV